jgi:twinkle protein
VGEFVRHEECPNCGSKDNLARYADGGAFCFGCGHVDPAEGTSKVREVDLEGKKSLARAEGSPDREEWLTGDFRPIKSRHLTEETCRKFGYKVGRLSNGDYCHLAPYYDSAGKLVAQKVRPPNKDDMFVQGTLSKALLFGQYVNRSKGKRVIVTEGEIDCMSVSQALGHSWAVVSVKRGAAGAAKDLKEQIEWLESFDEIVLMFDSDEPGQKATQECVQLFTPGKVRVARLPLKDPSDMLVSGRVGEITQAVFDARVWRPDGVRSLREVANEAKAPIAIGLPWYLPRLTELTYGRRLGEVVVLGGGTGCGKTDFISEQVVYDVMTLGEKTGLFFFEQQNFETARRLAGKHASKAFHIPGEDWTQEQLNKAVDEVANTDHVFVYNHFGQTDWDVVRSRMRYLAVNEGVKLFYIDNLSSLADPSNERESLEKLMAEAAGLAQELLVWVLIVSHLATPEGKPHEEGGHVALRHFKGARAISHWAFFALGLERNKVAEDPDERLRARLVCLKDRYTGRADGESVELVYDQETCRLGEYTGHIPQPTPTEFKDTDTDAPAALLA